jgi:DNA-directed RNA polymerase specialized sigma24 family protein
VAAIWGHLVRAAHRVITSTATCHHCKATQLVRDLHPVLPATPADIITAPAAVNLVLPDLAELARRHNPRALLLAAALMRRQLCDITCYRAGGHDADDTSDDAAHTALTEFWTALTTSTKPTTRSLHDATLRRVIDTRRVRRAQPAPAGELPEHGCDADYTADAGAAGVLERAHAGGTITALEHRTLCAVYLADVDTVDLTAAARTLGATSTAVARRTQRGIAKLRAARGATRTEIRRPTSDEHDPRSVLCTYAVMYRHISGVSADAGPRRRPYVDAR